jgi:hypothetical protein
MYPILAGRQDQQCRREFRPREQENFDASLGGFLPVTLGRLEPSQTERHKSWNCAAVSVIYGTRKIHGHHRSQVGLQTVWGDAGS